MTDKLPTTDALEGTDYASPMRPLTVSTMRNLHMARHLEINASGCCVECAKHKRFIAMRRTTSGLVCLRCGATRGH